MKEFFTNFVQEFKYEIGMNLCEFIQFRMNLLHQKLAMLRIACTVSILKEIA